MVSPPSLPPPLLLPGYVTMVNSFVIGFAPRLAPCGQTLTLRSAHQLLGPVSDVRRSSYVRYRPLSLVITKSFTS